jgi:hypothetical protein
MISLGNNHKIGSGSNPINLARCLRGDSRLLSVGYYLCIVSSLCLNRSFFLRMNLSGMCSRRHSTRVCHGTDGSTCLAFFAHPLRVQNPSFARSDLFPHHRLLLERHLLRASRDSVRLFLTNRHIGWLTRARAAFDVNIKGLYGQVCMATSYEKSLRMLPVMQAVTVSFSRQVLRLACLEERPN